MATSPRQRRKARNRYRILDTATHLIVKKGIENLSLREIAKQADYSPAALYKYFNGKQAIIQAVQTRQNKQLLELLTTVQINLSPRDQLIEQCLMYIRYCLENPAFLILVNTLTTGRKSKQQPAPPNSPYPVFYQTVQAWVQDEDVTLADDYDIEDITYALWATIHGMATLRLNQLKDFEADFDKTNRRTLEIFLKGLRQRE
jgi:AcrR family transcriptional regulator